MSKEKKVVEPKDTVSNHDMVAMTAIRTGLDRKDVELVYETFKQITLEELLDGHDVVFNSWLVFKHVVRAPRKGRNPRSGEPLDIPERNKIKIRNRRLIDNYTANTFEELEDVKIDAINEYRAKVGLAPRGANAELDNESEVETE